MKFNAEEYLKKLHTKQLLLLREKIYKIKPNYDFIPSNEQETLDQKYGQYDVSNNFQNWYVNLNDVKKELKTREHIPNAKEAKEIRQNKAKFKH